MTECNKCGDCCKVIPFNYTKKYLRDWLSSGDMKDKQSAKFILKYWHRISKSEASKINPLLHFKNQYAYICDKWDKETKLCMAHDERPPVCSHFPWYGKPPPDLDKSGQSPLGYLPDCSFKADIPVAFITKV